MECELDSVGTEVAWRKQAEFDGDIDSINLLHLPLEIFLKICSYLEADFIPTLSLVCRRFAAVLADKALWRCWVSRRLKYSYPALRELKVWQDVEVNWRAACGDIDRETRRWTRLARATTHKVVREAHYATIDSLLLFNNSKLCISGGRDRALALWDVEQIGLATNYTEAEGCKQYSVPPVQLRADAHRGWVWDFAVDHEDSATTVYSGSWDNTLKAWDLHNNLENKTTYKCVMSVLSVVADGPLVFAGLYSRQVCIFDTRAGTEPITKYKLHKGPVLKLQNHNDFVASLSEDRTIAVWDKRAGKSLVKDIKCTTNNNFPATFNWSQSGMYVGDSKGSIHLIDPEQFVHRKSYRLWPEPEAGVPCDKVVAIHQGLGSLLVASDRGNVKCLYPSDPVEEFASFNTAANLITNMHYSHGILAVGTCQSSLEFWFPKEEVTGEQQLTNNNP